MRTRGPMAPRVAEAVAEPLRRALVAGFRQRQVRPQGRLPLQRPPLLEVGLVAARLHQSPDRGRLEPDQRPDALDACLGVIDELLVANDLDALEAALVVREELVAAQPVLDERASRRVPRQRAVARVTGIG